MTEDQYRNIEVRAQLLDMLLDFETQSRKLLVHFSYLNANSASDHDLGWMETALKTAEALRATLWQEKEAEMQQVVSEWSPGVDFDAIRAKIQDSRL